MGCTRIMNQVFSDTDLVANFSVSSQQSAFPGTNLLNKQRRSKVWRSNGYWEIVSGANTIVFRENGVTNLTATVAAANYTSTATFVTAVAAALVAASTGGVTYTVTQTGNYKFTITSNGFGGATFQLIWTHANSASMAAVMGYDDSVDDTGGLAYIADELKIHTVEYVLFDFGIATNPQAFILIGPRNDPNKISPSATIVLQGSETNNFTTPSYSQAITYNDEVMETSSDTGLHTEGLRYWRLKVIDQNPLGYVEIGKIFLGNYFTATRGSVHFPLGSDLIDRSVTSFSEGGQSYTDILPKSQAFRMQWAALTKSELEDLVENTFNRFGTGIPFFVSLDPNAFFSTSGSKYIRFVKFDRPPSFSLDKPNYFKTDWVLREEL